VGSDQGIAEFLARIIAKTAQLRT